MVRDLLAPSHLEQQTCYIYHHTNHQLSSNGLGVFVHLPVTLLLFYVFQFWTSRLGIKTDTVSKTPTIVAKNNKQQ